MDEREYSTLRQRADHLHESGDLQGAITLYNTLLAEQPEDTVVLLARCAAHHGRENYELAIADAERVLELDPENSRAAFNLGLAQNLGGETRSSLQYFEQAIQLDPEFSKAHVALANVLSELGRHQEAVKHYERADQLGSGLADLPVWWAQALRWVGRYDDAYQLYARRLECGASAAAEAGRAQCAYLRGDDDARARELLEAVVADDPEDHDSLVYYLALRFAQGASRSEIEALIPRADEPPANSVRDVVDAAIRSRDVEPKDNASDNTQDLADL
jgi:tetratricopeptide (TPR) repeat protein